MFSVFRVLDFWPIFLLFCSWFCSPPKNYPPNFCPLFRVAKKTGENKGFRGVVSLFFFSKICYIFLFITCGVLMLDFPLLDLHRCKCLIRPGCLTCSFCFLFVFRSVFFFGGGGGYSSFYINHFNGPVPMTKKQDQTTENPNIWNYVFDVLLGCLHPHIFTWPTS